MATKKTKEMRGWGWFPSSPAMRDVVAAAIEARMPEIAKSVFKPRLPKKRPIR